MNDLKRAADSILSGLTTTPEMQENLIRTAMASQPRKRTEGVSPANRVKLKLNFSLSFGLPHLIVAAIVIIAVMVLPLFLPGQRAIFKSWQSEDGEYYMVQGHESDSHPQIAEADSTLPPVGNFQPATYEEACTCYGAMLPVLNFLPEGTALNSYSVSVLDVCRSCLTTYLTKDGIILFQVREFFEASSAYTYVEQDGEGEHVQLSNGQQVYITTNGPYLTVTWQNEENDFMLSGSFTREEAIRMAESVKVP